MEYFDLVSWQFQQSKSLVHFFLFPRQLYSDNMQYAFVQKDAYKTTKLAIFPLKTQKPHSLIEYLGSFILLLF